MGGEARITDPELRARKRADYDARRKIEAPRWRIPAEILEALKRRARRARA
jgi:hypothetical protein